MGNKVVKAIIQNADDEILAVKEEESGKWELPGGFIEEGEDRFSAGKREIEEETGLEAKDLQDVIRIELEDENTINCYVIYTESFSGEVNTGSDVSDYKWVSKEEFVSLDLHRDSAYNIPPVAYLEDYLDSESKYSEEGREIDVVKILLRNEEGKFLAVKKSHLEKVSSGEKFKKYGEMSGKWELPGGRIGKVEGEDRFEAAERELEQELGIRIKGGRDVVREEFEETNTVNTYILLYDDWNGSIELSEEHTDYRWVMPEEYLKINWHEDAGYGYPPMKFLEDYLGMEKSY